MNLIGMFGIWRKRRILTALALLVALAASGMTMVRLPRTYQAESTVLLVPSRRAAKTVGDGNPYLSFTGSLATAADVLATELTAPPITRRLAARGFSEPYTAVSESTTSQTVASGSDLPGPFVLLTVTGSDQARVEQTLRAVHGAVQTTVTAMQRGIAPSKRLTVSTLSTSPQATASLSKTARSLVLVIGVLIAVALSLPLLVDAQLARRRLRRAQRALPARPPTCGGAVPDWGISDAGGLVMSSHHRGAERLDSGSGR
jgi:hypothetical protein